MPGVPTQNPPTNNPILQGKIPWYRYPRIDNLGEYPDPAGPYRKPDSNIQVPGGYPITALLSGTVTSVQTTTWGQRVITVKLDKPLNDEATHTFYEHMSSSTVTAGQHVAAGDLIGYNNPSGTVPLGFGLYSGDVYGSGPAWDQLQNDLAPGGANKLNPVNLLNQASKGNLVVEGTGGGGFTGSYNQSITGTCAPWDIGCMMGQMRIAGEAVAIFTIALALILVGLFILSEREVLPAAKTAAKGALLT